MARYSEHDTSKISEAVQTFRDNCLLRDGALVFDGADEILEQPTGSRALRLLEKMEIAC